MKHLSALALILGLGWPAYTLPAQAAEAQPAAMNLPRQLRDNGFPAQTASWTVISTRTEKNGRQTTSTGKFWISGDQYRMEGKDPQQDKTLVFIDNGRERYLYTPEEKKAIRWGPALDSLYAGLLNSDMVAESVRQVRHAKKLGSGTVDGKACDILAYPSTVKFMNTEVTSRVKTWVWKDKQFPLKSIVKTPPYTLQIALISTPVPASETTQVVKELVLDQPIPDSLFTLPPGTQVENPEDPSSLPRTGEKPGGVLEETGPDATPEENSGEVRRGF